MCRIVKHKEGADPAAVVYDAMEAAKARNADPRYRRYGWSSTYQG